MLECGCGLDSRQQPLTHETGNGRVPVELQHRSIVVKGWVRVINEEPKVEEEHVQLLYINAVKAEVTQALRLGPTGWSLDEKRRSRTPSEQLLPKPHACATRNEWQTCPHHFAERSW